MLYSLVAKSTYINTQKSNSRTSLMVWWLGLHLPVQVVWFQPLVGELRSHMPHGQKTKIQHRSNTATNSIKSLKMVHIKKIYLQKKFQMQGHSSQQRKAEHQKQCTVYFISAAAKSLQLCPTLCSPIDGSPPGSSTHGIFQARVLEWAAIDFISTNPVFYNSKVKFSLKGNSCKVTYIFSMQILQKVQES